MNMNPHIYCIMIKNISYEFMIYVESMQINNYFNVRIPLVKNNNKIILLVFRTLDYKARGIQTNNKFIYCICSKLSNVSIEHLIQISTHLENLGKYPFEINIFQRFIITVQSFTELNGQHRVAPTKVEHNKLIYE